MVSDKDILKKLKAKARPDQLEGMARYAMVKERRLGVSIPDLRKLAKEIGKDHELALNLWKSGFQEARILAAMIDLPEEVTEEQMEALKTAELTGFELYNLKQDIGESIDLAETEPARLQAMKERLVALYRDVRGDSPVWPAWKSLQSQPAASGSRMSVMKASSSRTLVSTRSTAGVVPALVILMV